MNSISSSNENIISKILEFDPNILEQKSRFKALLMDLLPQDKLTKNLILLSYEEQIHLELIGKSRIDSIEVMRLCKKLMDVCGCDRNNAEKIIRLWEEALTGDIKTVSDNKEAIQKSSIVPGDESITVVKKSFVHEANRKRKAELAFWEADRKSRDDQARQDAERRRPIELDRHEVERKQQEETITTKSVSYIEKTEAKVENVKLYYGEYCGRFKLKERVIEDYLKCDYRYYPIIPFELDLQFIHNKKIGDRYRFKIAKIGQYEYAYDLTLLDGSVEKERSRVVNTGKDVLHRTGILKTINDYECLVHEDQNRQIYKGYLSRRVKTQGLKEGDIVKFMLGISDGILFANEITRQT